MLVLVEMDFHGLSLVEHIGRYLEKCLNGFVMDVNRDPNFSNLLLLIFRRNKVTQSVLGVTTT